MTKYARSVDGCWIDVYRVPEDFDTLEDLQRCIPGDFIQVDDACNNGDFVGPGNTVVPRPPAVPPVVYAVLAMPDFKTYCYSQLGGGTTGKTRFGQILLAAKASSDPSAFAAWDQYSSAEEWSKSEGTDWTALLVTGSCMTANEKTAIDGHWPRV